MSKTEIDIGPLLDLNHLHGSMKEGFRIVTSQGHAEIGVDECAPFLEAARRVLQTQEHAKKLRSLIPGNFVRVPETVLPDGTVVPAFMVDQYHATRRCDGTPWVSVDYHSARQAAEHAGLHLITETQYLAIAYNLAQQGVNWTGWKVGEGRLFQGIRKHGIKEVQPHDYQPEDGDERRWHELSTGERIYDFAGHVSSWVFDDVQGDEFGVPAHNSTKGTSYISAKSPSHTVYDLCNAMHDMKRSGGRRPLKGVGFSGQAITRGGAYESENSAGIFAFGLAPVAFEQGFANVGFRCTKPIP